MLAFSSHPNLSSLSTKGAPKFTPVRKANSCPNFGHGKFNQDETTPASVPSTSPSSRTGLKDVFKNELAYATLLSASSTYLFGEHHHIQSFSDIEHMLVVESLGVVKHWWEHGNPFKYGSRKTTIVSVGITVLLPVLIRYSWAAIVSYYM